MSLNQTYKKAKEQVEQKNYAIRPKLTNKFRKAV